LNRVHLVLLRGEVLCQNDAERRRYEGEGGELFKLGKRASSKQSSAGTRWNMYRAFALRSCKLAVLALVFDHEFAELLVLLLLDASGDTA